MSQENRGGSRPGAGRKPLFEISDRERREIIKSVKRECEKNNTDIGQELGRLICGKNVREKLAAISLFTKDVLPKISESESTRRTVPAGPMIYEKRDEIAGTESGSAVCLPKHRHLLEPIDPESMKRH